MVFLKVNLCRLFHYYKGVEGFVGSDRNISLEKVNILRVFLAPQQICYEIMTLSTPTLLKVLRGELLHLP